MTLLKSGNRNRIAFAVRLLTVFAGVFIVSLSQVSAVNAQSAQCLRLQNQLSALSMGGTAPRNTSKRYRQYDKAVKSQRAQIAKTQRMAQRSGCRRNSVFGRNASSCNRIFETLGQMNANLASLEQQRRRLAPQRSRRSNGNRNAIIRAMNQRRCFSNGILQQQVSLQPRRRSLVEQIFGARTFRNDGRRGDFNQFDSDILSRSRLFRTMCVRKQDGYYFPISFSTTPERFDFDESICQSKCPSTDVALYYHAMPGQDSEDMVSYRENQPYADLPKAFAYRTKFDPEASCRFSSGILQEIAGSAGERDGLRDVNSLNRRQIAKPVYREDRGLDPETIANQLGRFDDRVIAGLLNKPDKDETPHALSKSQRRVRVVGPAFFPVQ